MRTVLVRSLYSASSHISEQQDERRDQMAKVGSDAAAAAEARDGMEVD